MTPFSFLTASRIIFGRGTATQAAGIARSYGQNILLVHGATPARADWLHDALTTHGAIVTRLACPFEPTLPMLEHATALARQAHIQVVIALGGGAVIDLGKAVAALIPASGPPLDYLEVVGRGLPLPAAPLPFIALPTTSGTGAEVTKNAVIGIPDAARKVSLRDDRMLPAAAIIDPALSDHLPWNITLASGLDALTQVIEPYLSNRANPLTDALCRAAIPLALPALMRLSQAEDPAARDQMAYVSLSGGLALANSGLGAVHGFAGVIGGMTGAAHGAICGALLPHVLRALQAGAAPSSGLAARLTEVQNWLAPALNCPPEQTFTALATWAMKAGLPGLKSLGTDPASLETIAEQSRSASSMKASALAFSPASLIAILQAAL